MSMPPDRSLDDLKRQADRLRRWLFDEALPFWWMHGADRRRGGFHEKIAPDGAVVEEPRRARVAGRQVFVFATAKRMGWRGPADDALNHALDTLVHRHVAADGALIALTDADGAPLDARFDLYDHAFALFGLAAARAAGERTEEVETLADRILARMRGGWKHPEAGFEEAAPRSLPLKANPHMHMLEASLAWEDAGGGPIWRETADEITRLCLARFLAPDTGALHEFYNGDWRRIVDPALDVIEPGHQFEWAWLLLRWGARRSEPAARRAARRLIAVGETRGVDAARDLAIDGLDAALNTVQPLSRLWPQTERIKAWAALAIDAADPSERAHAVARATAATAGLLRYTDHPLRGSWWENIDVDGAPLTEPARTSSLYHIVCAADVLTNALTQLDAG